ncbi:MAG: type IV toxin-antitoxin system AbiEi family antitoxin [Prevotellaceae bacterium]|jgi:predicted transcriptional regulator of viral defense system|nr:type IV toxin-antitoxin system AbiEi family antitoxin [Prevotellaceae bacterium]
MQKKELYIIDKLLFNIQKEGRITFSNEDVKKCLSDKSVRSIELALNRLILQKKIVPVLKGFYAIILPEYAVWSMVPPVAYLDDLMKYLKRPYYLALLNAAEFYGAAHQKPMEHFVITVFPPMRNTLKRNVKVNFSVTRKIIPQQWLKSFKTQNGIIMVSKPELTAADLITFQKEIGGLNRACTVLYELMETVKFGKLDKAFFDYVPTSTIQRLGYLLENELKQQRQANILFSKSKTHGRKFQIIPLKYSKPTANCKTDTKWKIIINETIEIDDL